MTSCLVLLPDDYQWKCRTCSLEGNMREIFNNKSTIISEMIKEVADIEIVDGDYLPQNICSNCCDKLEAAYEFRKLCRKSDKTFRIFIDQLKNVASDFVKVEIGDQINYWNDSENDSHDMKCDETILYQMDTEKTDITSHELTKEYELVEDQELEEDKQFERSPSSRSNFKLIEMLEHESNDEESCQSLEKTELPKNNLELLKILESTDGEDVRMEVLNDSSLAEDLSDSTAIKDTKTKLKIRSKFGRKRNTCPICNKAIKHGHFTIHLRTHTKEKPFECEICEKRFSVKFNLQRHVRTHTGERPYTCTFCYKGFIQHTSLTNHIRAIHTQETPFPCTECGKSFTSKAKLTWHTKIKHTEYVPPRPPKKAPMNVLMKLFRCDMCHRSFANDEALQAHRQRHGNQPYLCSECGKGFFRKYGLEAHQHAHTGQKPYTCPFCNKGFGHLSGLHTHKLIHTGEKPYVCQVCNKAFTQSSHLKYHVRIHSGDRPYECSVCGKKFALNGTLTVHMRIHTGETPFHCPICEKGFYSSTSMKKHRARHATESNLSL